MHLAGALPLPEWHEYVVEGIADGIFCTRPTAHNFRGRSLPQPQHLPHSPWCEASLAQQDDCGSCSIVMPPLQPTRSQAAQQGGKGSSALPA